MSYEIPENICEICGQPALSGILENDKIGDIKQIRIRYSCIDHYIQLYQKIRDERRKDRR
jgi:hypothetical protein